MPSFPDFVLWLGDFGFAEFEVPEHIEGSMVQSLVVHNYPGGNRTIDAMGAHRGMIAWSGDLMDNEAADRRNSLEAIAKAGQSVLMTYDSRVMMVMVRKLQTTFRRFWQIHYSIEVEVVDDLAQPNPEDAINLNTVLALDQAAVITDALILAAYDIALATDPVSGLLAAAGDIASASTHDVQALTSLVTNQQSISAGLLGGAEQLMVGASAPALFASGVDPIAMAVGVAAVTTAAVTIPATLDASARSSRMGRNLNSVGA